MSIKRFNRKPCTVFALAHDHLNPKHIYFSYPYINIIDHKGSDCSQFSYERNALVAFEILPTGPIHPVSHIFLLIVAETLFGPLQKKTSEPLWETAKPTE